MSGRLGNNFLSHIKLLCYFLHTLLLEFWDIIYARGRVSGIGGVTYSLLPLDSCPEADEVHRLSSGEPTEYSLLEGTKKNSHYSPKGAPKEDDESRHPSSGVYTLLPISVGTWKWGSETMQLSLLPRLLTSGRTDLSCTPDFPGHVSTYPSPCLQLPFLPRPLTLGEQISPAL